MNVCLRSARRTSSESVASLRSDSENLEPSDSSFLDHSRSSGRQARRSPVSSDGRSTTSGGPSTPAAAAAAAAAYEREDISEQSSVVDSTITCSIMPPLPPPSTIAKPSLGDTCAVGLEQLAALQRELEELEQSYDEEYGLGGGNGEDEDEDENVEYDDDEEEEEGNDEGEAAEDFGPHGSVDEGGEVLRATGTYDHSSVDNGEESDVVQQGDGEQGEEEDEEGRGEEEEEGDSEEDDDDEELELVMIRPGCYQCPRTKKFFMLKDDL